MSTARRFAGIGGMRAPARAPAPPIGGEESTPLTIAGAKLHCWYSHTYSTISAPSGIESISDASGNGRTISQSTESKRPALGTYFIEHTDGSTHRLKTATSMGLLEGEFIDCWILGKHSDGTPTFQPSMFWSMSNTGGTGGSAQLGYNGGEYVSLAVLNTGPPDKTQNINTGVAANTELHVFRTHVGNDLHEWEDYGDAVQSTTASGASGLGENQTELSLGSSAPYDTLAFGGHWAEFACVVNPTAAERAAMTAWFVARGDAIAALSGDTTHW